MSIGVGTLQPKTRVVRPVWIGALVATVAAVSLAVIVANYEAPARQATAATQAGRPLVNTPTELSGGIVGFEYAGISVNTPSELRGGVIGASMDVDFTAVPHVPKRTDMTAVPSGTPTELSGGLGPDLCLHQCT